MKRDDIIRMAREAGYGEVMSDLHAPALERFAALVAQAEREACAKLVWQTEESGDEYVSLRETVAAAIRARGE